MTPITPVEKHGDPLVSLIVLNWNGLEYLPVCLGSLQNSTYKNLEILFVDNGSKDESLKYVRENFPDIRVIVNSRNLGFAAGNNVGIRAARGEFIGLMNTDIEVKPDWLEEIVRSIQTSERIAGAAGRICALGDFDLVMFTLTKIDPESAAAYWIKQESPPRFVDYLSGNSMVFRRSAIEHVGLLDHAYFCYYEDTDWAARMIMAGYDLLYVPTALVGHKQMGSAPSEFHYYLMIRNRLRFALKNFDIPRLPRFFKLFMEDMKREIASNKTNGASERNRLVRKALAWNFMNLPLTLISRIADRIRMRKARSYNENMPLRGIRCNGQGGYEE